MATEIYGTCAHETHEQFVQRASRVFPAELVGSWSRVERAVFNHLLGQMINRHGYESISDEMLEQSLVEMNKIVRQLVEPQAANDDGSWEGHHTRRHLSGETEAIQRRA